MGQLDHKRESPDEELHREETARIVAATARAYARREAQGVLKRYRNQALIGFLVLLLGLGYAIKDTHDKSRAGRSVLCQIIERGDKQAYIYRDEHTITTQQLHRALAQSVEYRKLLNAGCSLKITPPPKHVTPRS